jgi:DNA-binding PadR family transcriptional regulator
MPSERKPALYTMSDLERISLMLVIQHKRLTVEHMHKEIERIGGKITGATGPYYTLTRLEGRGFLTSDVKIGEKFSGRSMRAWSITPEGITALKKSFELLEKVGVVYCTIFPPENNITIVDRSVE